MNKCETCRANKVCDHNRFGFETCGNYIPTNEWISVEERKPHDIGYYLCLCETGNFQVFKFFDGCFNYFDGDCGWLDIYTVTHWMPLPEPPKGE